MRRCAARFVEYVLVLLLALTGVLATDAVAQDEFEFEIVVIPDPQNYVNWDVRLACWNWKEPLKPGPGLSWLYERQTRWVVGDYLIAGEGPTNPVLVVTVGDLIQNDDEKGWKHEWTHTRDAQAWLDGTGGVPFTVVPGNHDIPYGKGKRNYTHLNRYFRDGDDTDDDDGTGWVSLGMEGQGVTVRPGGGVENHYFTFNQTFSHEGSPKTLKFLVLGLEVAPPKEVLQWANSVLEMPEHHDHRVIVVTHSYLDYEGNLSGISGQGGGDLVGHNGAELWYEFVSRHSSIFLVLCGHRYGSLVQSRTNNRLGNVVHEVIADFAAEGVEGWCPNGALVLKPFGGGGWFRWLRFKPTGGTFGKGLVVSQIESVFEGAGLLRGRAGDKNHYPKESYKHGYSFHYNMVDDPEDYRYSGAETGEFGDMTVNQQQATFDDPDDYDDPDKYEYEEDTSDEKYPAIAMDGDGDFVIVWQTDKNGRKEIFMAGFNKGGWRRFHDRQVAPDVSPEDKTGPEIAMNAAGDFVVVWQSGGGIWGRGMKKAEAVIQSHLWPGTEDHVPAEWWTNKLAVFGSDPDVAIDDEGNTVVVWAEYDLNQIGLKGISATEGWAEGLDSVWEAHSSDKKSTEPAVAMDPAGENIVVVWQEGDGDDQDIVAKCFFLNDAGGWDQLDMPVDSSGENHNPDVAMDAHGNLVIAWEHREGTDRISAKSYEMVDGAWKVKDEVQVSDHDRPRLPKVAMNAAGDFAVAWYYGNTQVGAWSSDGEVPIPVHPVTQGDQNHPAVAMGMTEEDSYLVVAWQDDSDKDGDHQIIARGLLTGEVSVVCPPDMTVVPNDPGECGAWVEIDRPISVTGRRIVTDGLEPICGPVSDQSCRSFFAVGEKLVNAKVTFEDDSEAMCTFEIEVSDTELPVVATDDYEVPTDPGVCTTDIEAYGFDIPVVDNCPPLPPMCYATLGEETVVAGNTTTVTCRAYDYSGNWSDHDVDVTVFDNEPPILSKVVAAVGAPSEKSGMVDVDVEVTVTENCSEMGGVMLEVEKIEKMEPSDQKADGGMLVSNWEVVSIDHDAGLIRLRLPLEGGNYEIFVKGTDANGNSSSPVSTVIGLLQGFGMEIPTLTTKGIVVLALLLLGTGIAVISRIRM